MRFLRVWLYRIFKATPKRQCAYCRHRRVMRKEFVVKGETDERAFTTYSHHYCYFGGKWIDSADPGCNRHDEY
jgi:hypothetical protein